MDLNHAALWCDQMFYKQLHIVVLMVEQDEKTHILLERPEIEIQVSNFTD